MLQKSLILQPDNFSGNDTLFFPQQKGDILKMNEKIYKAMGRIGASDLAIGICILTAAIPVGVLLIVNGARLLHHKSKILF